MGVFQFKYIEFGVKLYFLGVLESQPLLLDSIRTKIECAPCEMIIFLYPVMKIL